MSRPIFILFAFLAVVSCGKEDIIGKRTEKKGTFEQAQEFFDETRVPKLSISISPAEWNRLLHLYDEDNDTHAYVQCKGVRIEDENRSIVCHNVGLRLRGNTSRRRPEGWNGQNHSATNPLWRRVHFGLNTRTFSDTGSFEGIRRVNLKYAKEDPTYIREHYSYDLLAKYGVWTAPMTSWCRLYFNIGEDVPVNYGVYLMIESIDKRYIKRRSELFGGDGGWLWKCGWGANLSNTDNWRFHQDDNSSKSYPYDLKDDNPEAFAPARDQLKDFITRIIRLKGDDFKEWISRVMDVDLLLKMYAANIALGHWDDYWNNMNNYYLYFNSRDPQNYKVFMLPYDYDNTLGTSHNVGAQNDSGRQDPYHWGINECPLISKILEISEFRDKYTSYLRDFSSVDNPWTGQAESASRIRGWQSLIGPYIANDTGEDMVIADKPASWGNHSEYRLLENSSNNWFKVKAESIRGWIK